MLKKNISKFLIIVFIGCISAMAFPTEATASVNAIYGTFSPWDNVNDQMDGVLFGYRLWGTLHIGRFCPDGGFSDGDVCKVGFWNKHGVFVPVEEFEELPPGFEFDLLSGEYLQVMVSMDAECDVFDLKSGSLLLENFRIDGNNSFQTVPVMPSNSPYLIVFKVDGKVIALQHFLFIDPNSLFIGGQDE